MTSKRPPKLEFFNGGWNLRFEQIINDLGMNQDSKDFLHFLQDDICQCLMWRNKLRIHIEQKIFTMIILILESIDSFFIAQQDHTKKLMPEDIMNTILWIIWHKFKVKVMICLICFLTKIQNFFFFLSIQSIFSTNRKTFKINKTHCNRRR